MTLDESGRRFFADIVARRRDELVDRATDWVIAESADLKSRRPREETRKLVDRCVAGYEALLLRGDPAPLSAFTDFVTSLRASSEFRVSTLLRGFLSFRRALEAAMRDEPATPALAFDVLAAVDDVYFKASFKTADIYEEKLVDTIVKRKRELERELGEVTARKTRELDEKIAVIEEQRAMVAALSSPLIRVWRDILVLPLIGAWGRDRAAEIVERTLSTIQTTRARVLLVDITGLSEVNEDVVRHLHELARATSLIGSSCFLVGVRPSAARALVEIGGDLRGVRAFATLYDGLRAALTSARRSSAAR